jgi:hypothetical protein
MVTTTGSGSAEAPEMGSLDSRGILYVATGRRHLDEMMLSAESARRHMPGIPLVLYTDQREFRSPLFTEIRSLANPRHAFVDKVAPLVDAPFERTLFLDTDTLVCAPLDELFELLDRVELAVTHAPLRHDRPFRTPNCFCEVNTGVVAYRRTPAVRDLFRDWLAIYQKEIASTGRMDSDQPAFREALYRSSVSFYVLPPEYNLRTVMPAAVGRCKVRIIHGRARDMAALERWVNESRSIRVFLPNPLLIAGRHFAVLSPVGRVVGTLLSTAFAPFRLAERVLRAIKRGEWKLPIGM